MKHLLKRNVGEIYAMAVMKARRERETGLVGAEGFWRVPPRALATLSSS